MLEEVRKKRDVEKLNKKAARGGGAAPSKTDDKAEQVTAYNTAMNMGNSYYGAGNDDS